MKTRARCTSRWAVVTGLALGILLLSGPSLAKEQLKVEVTGVSDELLANVRASLGIVRQRNNPALTPTMIDELHTRAEDSIRHALEPFGYYRPTISTQLQRPNQPGEFWRASYRIDPGPQVAITEFDLKISGSGANDNELQAYARSLPLHRQPGLDHRHYEAAKSALLKRAKAMGYLKANYTRHRVEVDLANYTALIELHLATGPRYVVGPITLSQNRFANDYLQQFLILRPGEPLNQRRISQQRTTLSKSGYFQEVVVELGEPDEDHPLAIPILIQMKPYKPNRYRGRLGWGTDTGLGVQVDWTRRYLGSRGHHFNLGATAVEERKRIAGDLNYLIPINPVTGQQLELGIRHESKDLTYKDVDLSEGGQSRIAANLASAVWHFPGRNWADFELDTRAGISLVGESYDVFEVLFGNLPGEAQKAIIDVIGTDAYNTLSPDFEATVPAIRVTLRRSDDPLYIRRGDYLNFELLGSHSSVGSNITFWQARLNTWNIWPVGESDRLLLRTAAGYTGADSANVLGVNFNQMPEYYEFRAGGARSIRGYGFEKLFPSDAITGGKHQLVASVEYEHQVVPDWSVAVFLDGGNAFNDFDNIDEKWGAGVGIRWRSPVGLARLDLGIPLDKAEDSFQIYITIGPEF